MDAKEGKRRGGDETNSTSAGLDESRAVTRRRFLQGSLATAAGALTLSQANQVTAASSSGQSPGAGNGNRPNFLILMCDEMRFPPVYESQATKNFRQQYLLTQNFLRENGADFQRHYAASVACTPSRASMYTGQYPSLHGASQTDGAAKQAFDPDVFWLDPNGVPTLGHYFRTAGYATYWRGKWHASDADLVIPGTHNQLLSYNPQSGVPDPANQALYQSSDRLDDFGFSGWIGPEPHGRAPLNSGSSVPAGQQGRDMGFAQQASQLIQQLDHDSSTKPWFIMASFVNPHDITLWGLATNVLGLGFEFDIEPGVVPAGLFDPVLYDQTKTDDLLKKPSCQLSYQQTYADFIQPILQDPATQLRFHQYYYQLHKNVDEQMMTVLQTLLASRFKNNTIVVFTSDHGDLLSSHNFMYQKWYTAYDEAIRVPLIIWNKALFPSPRSINNLTSHVDLLPTLLGFAGISPEPIREILAADHTDALPLVGRDLSGLILGKVNPASVTDPVYFMTDDDPSRGLNQDNWTGIAYDSVFQPNHIETVIATLAGKVWKYSHYFDNPQFWSLPGDPVPNPQCGPTPSPEDVVPLQQTPTPCADGNYILPFKVNVKHTPVPDEFEMYNVTDDPMELSNLIDDGIHTAVQNQLAQLLAQQRCAKRLIPQSGDVPGQPTC